MANKQNKSYDTKKHKENKNKFDDFSPKVDWKNIKNRRDARKIARDKKRHQDE